MKLNAPTRHKSAALSEASVIMGPKQILQQKKKQHGTVFGEFHTYLLGARQQTRSGLVTMPVVLHSWQGKLQQQSPQWFIKVGQQPTLNNSDGNE